MYVMFSYNARGPPRAASHTPRYFFFCGAGSVITPRPREMSVVAAKRAYELWSIIAFVNPFAVVSQ